MSGFFHRLKNLGGQSAPPQILLGAFGKHPAWPEHIEGFADDRRMVEIKQDLYEGWIRGNIDSGEWGKLSDAGQAVPFNHTIVWSRGRELVLAHLWESRDYKNRPRYPMVVAALCQNVKPSWAISAVVPTLWSLGKACRALAEKHPPLPSGNESSRTTALQAVTGLILAARQELAALVREADDGDEDAGLAAIRKLAGHADFADADALANALYQIDYRMEVYRTKSSGGISGGGQHVRLPMAADYGLQSLVLWHDFLAAYLSRAPSLMLTLGQDTRCLDVIAGAPEASLLWHVKAAQSASIISSQVPHPQDTAFVSRVQALLDAAPAALMPADSGPAVTPSQPPRDAVASTEPGSAGKAATASDPSSARLGVGKRLPLIVVAVVVCLAVVVLCVIKFGRPASQPPATIVTPTTVLAPLPVAAPTPPPVSPPTVVAGDDPRSGRTPEQVLGAFRTAALELRNMDKTSGLSPGKMEQLANLETAAEKLRSQAASWWTVYAWTPEYKGLIVAQTKAYEDAVVKISTAVKELLDGEQTRSALLKQLLNTAAQTAGHYQWPALNTRWASTRNEVIKGVTGKSDPAAVQATLKRLEDLCKGLDDWRAAKTPAVPEVAATAPQDAWAGPVATAINNQLKMIRRRSLDDALASVPLTPELPLDSATGQMAPRLSPSAEQHKHAEEFLNLIIIAQSRLRDGWGLVRPAEGQPSLAELAAAIAADELFAALAADAAAKAAFKTGVEDPLAQLRQIDASKSVVDLGKVLVDETHPCQRLAAWTKLGDISQWPADKDQFQADAAFIRGFLQGPSAAQLAPAVRKSAQEQIAAQAPRHWLRFAGGACAPDDVKDRLQLAAQARDTMQGDPSKLVGAARYNWLVMELRDAAAHASAQDSQQEQLRQVAGQWLKDVQALGASAQSDATAAAFMAQVESSIKPDVALQQDWGPPAATWKRTENKDGAISYVWNDHTISFLLVPAAKESKTAAFYLATTTVSVGLLIDLLDSAKPAAWPALMDKADAPQGPMVWRHDRDWPNWQIAVAANWLTVEKAPADKLYWDKASVPRIERQTPLQQITGGMAVMVARLLNCRLPSAAEWQTACKMQLAAGQQLPWNIRGRTWQKQQEYVRQKRGESAIFANLPWADAGCFTPSVTDKINIQCDDQALAWQKCPWSGQATVPEDRLMFFRNVDADASGPFLHLIGNIDQFVCQWGNTPPLPDKFSAGDVENFLKDSQMAVIGASAISPPEMPYDQPFALGRHRLVSGRWSDVGIRLALPAVQKASATPLRQVIETASFIRIGA